MQCLLLTIFLSFFCLCIHAQLYERMDVDPVYLDSLMKEMEQVECEQEAKRIVTGYERSMLRAELRMDAEGVVPLLRGTLLALTDKGFVKEPARFAVHHNGVRDYCFAGAPLAVTWGLKAMGVPSRSKMQRMLTANVIGYALVLGLGEGMKRAFDERRPNGGDSRSMPSGHSAVAFASAAILSREYGHVSPWITVGGYTMATTTQLLRLKGNAHWVNDLVVGAGLGTVSANAGYFLADLIFGEKGINKPEMRRRDLARMYFFQEGCSAFSLFSGTEAGNHVVAMDDGTEVKLGASMSTGVEYSWHANQYVALEAIGRYSMSQVKAIGRNGTGDVADFIHAGVGVKVSTPFKSVMRTSVRLHGGVRRFSGFTVECDDAVYSIDSQLKSEIGTGFGIDFISLKSHVFGFSADYYYAFGGYLPHRFNVSSSWKVLF